MSRFRFPILLVAVALAAAAAGAWVASRVQPSAPPQLVAGTWLPQPRALPNIPLLDGSGSAFAAERMRGAPALMFFGFTHCPDICPTTLALLAQLRNSGALAQVNVLFVTVDPERDTPEIVGRYAAAFDESFIGLTGSTAAIQQLAEQLGVASARVELPGGGYTMDHSSTLFLFDAAARNVAVFTPPFDAQRLSDDLRVLAPHLTPSDPS
jgi:protein SCO1